MYTALYFYFCIPYNVPTRKEMCWLKDEVGRNINWCSHYESLYGGSQKPFELPYDPAIPLLGMYFGKLFFLNSFPLFERKHQLFCNVYHKKNLLQKENNYESICKIHA